MEGKTEIWKDIKGYKGVYQVSDCGRVKSLHKGSERFLRLQPTTCGYLSVGLYKKGALRAKYNSVHRLVMLNFRGVKNEKNLEVNHINGNKKDNKIVNLEWATRPQNQKHAFNTGLNKCHEGVRNSRAIFSEKHVRAHIK